MFQTYTTGLIGGLSCAVVAYVFARQDLYRAYGTSESYAEESFRLFLRGVPGKTEEVGGTVSSRWNDSFLAIHRTILHYAGLPVDNYQMTNADGFIANQEQINRLKNHISHITKRMSD